MSLNRPAKKSHLDTGWKPVPLYVRDDIAYVLPMAVFLVFTQAGDWWPASYPIGYIAKTLIVAILLAVLWPNFTKIRWDFWWLGALLGTVGVVQWVGMETLLLHYWPNYPRMHAEVFDPMYQIHSPATRFGFIAIRLAGALLVVPVMEELFWRDFLWRTLLAPKDFKLAEVGEWDWKVWIIVAAAFSCVHMQCWITALTWGLMIGGLLVVTRSLGACIIMHGVTNLLLGLYVLKTGQWSFW
jgi:CAAX prenyl protease-like protein